MPNEVPQHTIPVSYMHRMLNYSKLGVHI